LPVVLINRLTGKPANHLTAKANTVLSQSVIKTGFHTHRKRQDFLIFRNFEEGYTKSGKIIEANFGIDILEKV
jgi:hypothetical protein